MRYKIPSKSKPGKVHNVIDYGKTWECDCPAFIYKKNCRHIKIAKKICNIKKQF